MNITQVLRDQARARPDAPALACGRGNPGVPDGRVYSYAELDRVVDALAIRASGWDVAPGEHVVVTVKPHLPLLMLKLALARAGVPLSNVPVPGDPSLRLRLPDGDAPSGERTIVAAPDWWTQASEVPAAMHPGGDALLRHQGTSGTTGVPKLVPITHAMYHVRWTPPIGPTLPPEPRLLCVSGPGGLGFGYALSTFAAGGTVVLMGEDDDALDLVERERVDILVASPHAISATLERRPIGAARPPTLRRLVLSGARLTVATLRLASERACPDVVCMYGSTECGPLAEGPAAGMQAVDGATGFVLPGVEIQAVDGRDAVLPPGTFGRLRIRTPGLAREYYRDPETTARAFRGGWFYPNDVGTVTREGMLVIAGRADDLINVGGSKFAPESFESVLMTVPGIREAAAFGVPDALGKHVVYAAIVTDRDIEVTAIQAAFRTVRGLPPPSVVLRMPKLPRNEQGKLGRAELVRYAMALRDRRGPPPR